jgi:hypothetical protein
MPLIRRPLAGARSGAVADPEHDRASVRNHGRANIGRGRNLGAGQWYPLDTYQRAIWHFAENGLAAPENYRLPTLAAHFGLDPAGAHDALADVRLAAGIAQAIAEREGAR